MQKPEYPVIGGGEMSLQRIMEMRGPMARSRRFRLRFAETSRETGPMLSVGHTLLRTSRNAVPFRDHPRKACRR